jgi:hypothetical protein
MAHNIQLGPDAEVNHAVAVLRAAQATGEVTSEAHLVPGVYFALDPERPTAGTMATEEGDALSVRFEIEGKARWLGLHLPLGPIDLSEHHVLGVVCRSQAPQAITTRIAIRSGDGAGFSDCFLPKRMVSFGEDSTHLDVLLLEKAANLPAVAPWRELILFLPTASFEITVRDLRVFVV